MDKKGRHEHKMYINNLDYLILISKLKHLTKLDKNALKDGKYKIRSLYFDNYMDRALMEKFSGVSRREKFRIRFYGDNHSFIRLEKKSKFNRLCYKEYEMLSKEEGEKILVGDYGFLKNEKKPLFIELYTKINYQNLRPKVIVDYKREAYICHLGNVRITIDSDIRMSNNVYGFFNKELVTIPSAKGIILEVKYDGFLPEFIRQIIRMDNRQETEFSKYGVSRLV